jgi:hypothetical protein
MGALFLSFPRGVGESPSGGRKLCRPAEPPAHGKTWRAEGERQSGEPRAW